MREREKKTPEESFQRYSKERKKKVCETTEMSFATPLSTHGERRCAPASSGGMAEQSPLVNVTYQRRKGHKTASEIK